MKILILSCNTGEGHNSSGKALRAALHNKGIECDLIDTLAIKSEGLSKFVSTLYELSIKINLFGLVYRIAQWYSSLQLKIKSPIYLFSGLFAKRLAHIISEGGYDGIICVHLFPAEGITRIRRKYGQIIPTIFVMTDYTCIPLLYETELDRYIIAHEKLKNEFIENGLPEEKLYAIGIPINENKFATKMPKDIAQYLVNILFKWENADGKWYLIMGGSMGFGNIIKLIDELKGRIHDSDRIICICGKNNKLRHDVLRRFSRDFNIKAVGYTDQISSIMDACDILLTKPGGITSTEAIIKNIPLVHINPIKGLEEDNANFFRLLGMAKGGSTIQMQVENTIYLSHDTASQRTMSEAQRLNSNPNCSNEIADMIIDMVQIPES